MEPQRRCQMPMYEFQCSKCQHQFEELVKRGNVEVQCPNCQSVKVERLLSRVAFSVGGKFTASTGSSSCSGCSATSCGSCGSAH